MIDREELLAAAGSRYDKVAQVLMQAGVLINYRGRNNETTQTDDGGTDPADETGATGTTGDAATDDTT